MTEPPGRVLAIDLGAVRVGLALSDPLRMTAQPFGKIARRALKNGLDPIAELVRKNAVAAVVVGHPLLLSGQAGESARDAEEFAGRLRRALGVPVDLWDERLTSVQAGRALLEGDVRRARRKEVIDAAAATILLQSWLDRQDAGRSSST